LIMTLNSEIFGLPIPDAGPIFAAALVIHILSGLTAVIAGALAATARKRPGRHPRAGRVYLWALGGIFATATLMAIIRWHEDAHLFAIAVIAFSLGLYGYRARRRHRPGWPPHHAIGMGGSYIALLTGFYVDNGPFLPLWDRLPHITYWLLPSLMGIPLIWLALQHSGQRRFVSRVPESLAEAAKEPGAQAISWAVYRDQTPVGFVMIADEVEEPYIPHYLWKLLIDERYQRQGVGTATLDLIVRYFLDRPGVVSITTSAMEGDGSPIPFYERYGFERTGEMHDEEVVLRLDLRKHETVGGR
jgi:GNAT superfamily N-acetyltransferase